MATSDREKILFKTELWLLFTAPAFLVHVWAIVILLRDLSWVAERTKFRDALGFLGYGLTFSLLESFLVWLCLVLVGFLVLKNWEPNKRIAVLSTTALTILLGFMIGELIKLTSLPLPGEVGGVLGSRENPAPFIYGGLTIILVPGVFFLIKSAVFSQRYQKGLIEVLFRISPLMVLYLFFDFLALITVIIRNIQ